MKHCKKCGVKISKEANHCPMCGASQKQKTKTSNKKFLIATIAILLILLPCAIAWGVFEYQKDSGETLPTGAATGTEAVKDESGWNINIPFISKVKCGDGKCESDEDSSNCCMDCGCPSGYSCDNNACKKLADCGNGIVEEGETSENCCIDVGCPTGQVCQDNKCILLKPEISGASFTQTTDSYSVTYLKARGDNVGEITLRNTGNDAASNIKVTLSSPNSYFSDETINFGMLQEGASNIKTVSLNFLDKALDVTTDEDITIKAKITYSNSANQLFDSEESFDMHIAGRNYMTWGKPEMIASWITPTQPTIREFAAGAVAGIDTEGSSTNPIKQKMAARWLFESMRAYGVKYVNDAHTSGDYIQFPYETLKNKAGDCDDNAVLYASLLESIGLRSFLMLVPGHIFSGYVDCEGKIVAIETTASNFDNALYSGNSQYNKYKNERPLIYPTSEWYTYPQVNLPETGQIGMPSITKTITKDCETEWSWTDFWIASTTIKFVNDGDAPSAGCAAIAVYQSGQKVDEDYNCWTVNSGEVREETFELDISIFEGEPYCRTY